MSHISFKGILYADIVHPGVGYRLIHPSCDDILNITNLLYSRPYRYMSYIIDY